MLDVRVLVEMWYIWFGGFERVGRKGRVGRSITHLSHLLGCLTALQNTHAYTCASLHEQRAHLSPADLEPIVGLERQPNAGGRATQLGAMQHEHQTPTAKGP